MRNKLKPVLLVSCMAFAGAACADTAEDLARIEAETAVLKATARKVEVQAQIAAKQAEIDRLSAPPPVITGTALAPMPSDPTVLAVEGIGRKRYATLSFPGGGVMEVKVGDVLPNGLKVLAIHASEVIVGDGKKHRVRLARSSHAPAAGGSAYAAASGLPLPMPLPAPGYGAAQKGPAAR